MEQSCCMFHLKRQPAEFWGWSGVETRSNWTWRHGGFIWMSPTPRSSAVAQSGSRLTRFFDAVIISSITTTCCKPIAAPIWIFWLGRAVQACRASVTESGLPKLPESPELTIVACLDLNHQFWQSWQSWQFANPFKAVIPAGARG